MNNNDWTTIRSTRPAAATPNSSWGSSMHSRQMPSAFGSGRVDDDYTNKRREQERANAEAEAAIKAREAREAREKRDATAAKERDALALNSETSYPSLGFNSTATATPSKFAVNFRDKVAAMAAREKEAEEMRIIAAAAAASSSYDWMPTGLSSAAAAQRRRTLIGTRCFDDGPEDYTGPEEDFGDDISIIDDEEDEDIPPADNGEHNAHLADVGRRNKNSLY